MIFFNFTFNFSFLITPKNAIIRNSVTSNNRTRAHYKKSQKYFQCPSKRRWVAVESWWGVDIYDELKVVRLTKMRHQCAVVSRVVLVEEEEKENDLTKQEELYTTIFHQFSSSHFILSSFTFFFNFACIEHRAHERKRKKKKKETEKEGGEQSHKQRKKVQWPSFHIPTASIKCINIFTYQISKIK